MNLLRFKFVKGPSLIFSIVTWSPVSIATLGASRLCRVYGPFAGPLIPTIAKVIRRAAAIRVHELTLVPNTFDNSIGSAVTGSGRYVRAHRWFLHKSVQFTRFVPLRFGAIGHTALCPMRERNSTK